MKPSGRLLTLCLFTGMLLLCSDCCFSTTRVLKTAYKKFTVATWKGTEFLCEPYQVKKNDWLYKIFKKKGTLSEINFPLFLTIFKDLNTHISNPDTIRPGQKIIIPLKKLDPRDLSYRSKNRVIVPILQMSKLPEKSASPPKKERKNVNRQESIKPGGTPHESKRLFLQKQDMESIKRYAAMVKGRLFHTGTYYLPGPGQKDIALNLSITPLIELKDNSKTIILNHDFPLADFLKPLDGFWENVSFTYLDDLAKKQMKASQIYSLPKDRSSALKMLLGKAQFNLSPYETTLRMHGGIEIPIKGYRISLNNAPDLLIFLGNIYGNALTILKYEGYDILSLPPGDQLLEMSEKLFKALDIFTIKNPIFKNKVSRQTMTVPGLFVGNGKNLFISSQTLSPGIQRFFAKNGLCILQTNGI